MTGSDGKCCFPQMERGSLERLYGTTMNEENN